MQVLNKDLEKHIRTYDRKMKKKKRNGYRICPVCEIKHKLRSHCCTSCRRELGLLVKVVGGNHYRGKVSITKIVWLKHKYRTDNIFTLLKKRPELFWDDSNKTERLIFKKQIQKKQSKYKNVKYTRWESSVPPFVQSLMLKHKDKELLTISGSRENPFIHFVCGRCKKEQALKFKDLQKGVGHGCVAGKSTGEAVVEEHLKRRFDIKVQRETLTCINPLTGYRLPYDIEIVNKKILIEVQGKQHVEFVKYFHGTIDNFYYQQRKDDYKKRFAEKKGYKIIYIYYDEIKDGSYIQKLNF